MKKLLFIIITLISTVLIPSQFDVQAADCNDQGLTATCTCNITERNPYEPIVNNKYNGTEEGCQTICDNYWKNSFDEVIEFHTPYTYTCNGESTTSTAAAVPVERNKNFIKPVLNVPIPGLCKGANGENCFDNAATTMDENGITHTNLLGTYVAAWYKFLLIAASIVAVTMLAIAGLQYATAAGNTKQVEQAKKRIWNAISGMILLLLAYNIAFLVDPKTTAFKPLSIRSAPGIPLANKFPGSAGKECTDVSYLQTTDTWQKCMLETFGATPDDVVKTNVDFFDSELTVNAAIADNLYAIIDEISKDPELSTFDVAAETGEGSGFIWRCNTSDPRILSYHSWGMAIDIQPSKNPYCPVNANSGISCVPAGSCEAICASSTPTNIPPGIVDIFKKHGFEWGGDWTGSVKDYMHFQAKTVCEGGEIGK
jgi:hypothetical protein